MPSASSRVRKPRPNWFSHFTHEGSIILFNYVEHIVDDVIFGKKFWDPGPLLEIREYTLTPLTSGRWGLVTECLPVTENPESHRFQKVTNVVIKSHGFSFKKLQTKKKFVFYVIESHGKQILRSRKRSRKVTYFNFFLSSWHTELGNMRKIWRNMKKYVENMRNKKKYVKHNMKKFVKNTKE